MLLAELRKPTLQEALGCPAYNIFETLTTVFDTISWASKGDKDVGDAELNGEHFRLTLEPGTFNVDDATLAFINIAFAKIVNGKPTEELQLGGGTPSKLIGAVAAALLDRTKLYSYDAIVFIAADAVEGRLSLYNAIANRKWVKGKLGDIAKNIHLDNGGACTVLLAKELPDDVKVKFFDFLKTRGK